MSSPPASVDISVVIATCSRAGLLAQALESLLPQLLEHSAELVIVNDGSIDHTPQLLSNLQLTSSISITILQGQRQGVAAARNLAARHARGTWLASFDDDQIALPGWLTALHSCALQTGAAAIGGALSLHLPPGYVVDSLGSRTRSILGEHNPLPTAAPYPKGIRPATNNAFIRRDIFNKLNGYDPTFTEGAEDADFFDRLAATGQIIYFQPLAKALHLIPARRLEPASLRWTSLRIGAGDARLHQRRNPILDPLKLAAIRIAVSLLRDLPQLLFASPAKQLDTRCSLWYTQGLLRALPGILGNRPDAPFLRSLNFRIRNGERSPLESARVQQP